MTSDRRIHLSAAGGRRTACGLDATPTVRPYMATDPAAVTCTFCQRKASK